MTYPETKDVEIPEEIVEKWRKLVDIMAEIIDVPSGLIMRVKPPYIEVFSSSESDENPYEVGDREHLANLYCEEVIKSRDELLVPHAQKDERWRDNPDVELGMVSYLGYPLEWPDGDVFGTICVLDSEENRYGEKYEDLMREFRELVESHLKLIYQNKELEKQIRKRKEAEKRDEFLHSLLRHDLRNKIQVSLGYGELLKDTDLTDEQEELVGKDWIAKHDMMELIEKIRKLQEVEKEEVKEVSLNQVIQSMISKYREEAVRKNIETSVGGCEYTVMGGSFLEELFSNLYLNSLIHSSCNKVKIDASENNGEIVVTVEDDGIGIPDDTKEKIFERGITGEETGDTGLGLYLVKKIAEGYGGSIEVKDSELGGARFDVHLQKA